MGTRAITIFEDEGKQVGILYRQYDGGLDWHCSELTDWFKAFDKSMTVEEAMKDALKTISTVDEDSNLIEHEPVTGDLFDCFCHEYEYRVSRNQKGKWTLSLESRVQTE